MTVSEKRPTFSTVMMFRLAPSRMMASFSTFLDVKRMPGDVTAFGLKKRLMTMPMNSAMTDAPIKCRPASRSRYSSPLAAAAMTSAIARPGTIFQIVFIRTLRFFL